MRDSCRIVLDFIERINSGDASVVVAAMTSDHVFVDSAGSSIRGRRALLDAWRAYFRLFPDYRILVDSLVVRGDDVVVAGSSTGTLSAEGRAALTEADDAMPTKERLQGPAIWTARVRDGLVAIWRVYDDTSGNREALGIGIAEPPTPGAG